MMRSHFIAMMLKWEHAISAYRISPIFFQQDIGLGLQLEGIKNSVGSICQKLLKAQELGPKTHMKTGHFKAPSLPFAQTWAQASWPGEEPIEPGGLIWCSTNCRRNIKARNWYSPKQSTTYTGQPDWLDPWSCSEFNNQQILRIFKGPLNLQNRLPERTWKAKHGGLKVHKQHHSGDVPIWKFSLRSIRRILFQR